MHTSPDWYQIVQKSKNTKTQFIHIFSTFPIFKNQDHKNMTHFPLYFLSAFAIKGSKYAKNPEFIKIAWFSLDKSFRKAPISQKPTKPAADLL